MHCPRTTCRASTTNPLKIRARGKLHNCCRRPIHKPPANNERKARRRFGVISDEPDAVSGGIVWSADAVLSSSRCIRSITRIGGSRVSTWPTTRWSPQHRLTDAAWIDRSFNEFGWLKRQAHALVRIRGVRLCASIYQGAEWRAAAADSRSIRRSQPRCCPGTAAGFMCQYATAPYRTIVYRVPSGRRNLGRLTRLEGVESAELGPERQAIAADHRRSYMRTQIACAKRMALGALMNSPYAYRRLQSP